MTTPLTGDYPRLAVVLSFNHNGSMVLHTQPLFCFKDPVAFTDWLQTGGYFDYLASPLDMPFYYTLH